MWVGPKILFTEGHKPNCERVEKHWAQPEGCSQPLPPEYPSRGAPPPPWIRHEQGPWQTQKRNPLPALTMQGDPVFLKGPVYSGNHLQAPSTPHMIRPPQLPETILVKGREEEACGCPELIVFCSFAISVAFWFFYTIFIPDRFCRPFCSQDLGFLQGTVFKAWPFYITRSCNIICL